MFSTFNFEHFVWLANQQIVDFSGEALDEYRLLLNTKLERKEFDYTGFCMLPLELSGVALYALTCVFFQMNESPLRQLPWWFEEHFLSKNNEFLSYFSAEELLHLRSIFAVNKDNLSAFENLNELVQRATYKENLYSA
jgi:hypothetical protein